MGASTAGDSKKINGPIDNKVYKLIYSRTKFNLKIYSFRNEGSNYLQFEISRMNAY
jgi:hypothetical protein